MNLIRALRRLLISASYSRHFNEVKVMARPRLAVRPIEKTISIPTDIVARIDLELFSDIEGRVPHGKWSTLVVNLLRGHIAALDEEAAKVKNKA